MPDRPAANTRLIALLMMISAVTLAVVAGLIYVGVVPVPEDSRGIVAVAIGAAAAADFLVALWFFRKGQSS